MTAATTPTVDLYRDIHKGVRHALFTVTLKAGRTDLADDSAVSLPARSWDHRAIDGPLRRRLPQPAAAHRQPPGLGMGEIRTELGASRVTF
jgi:hypothetical protein